MSLTNEDLIQIRSLLNEFLSPVTGEIKALRNDIKEIYDMIAAVNINSVSIDKSFMKLPLKQPILRLNAAVIMLAQNEGVTLPH